MPAVLGVMAKSLAKQAAKAGAAATLAYINKRLDGPKKPAAKKRKRRKAKRRAS